MLEDNIWLYCLWYCYIKLTACFNLNCEVSEPTQKLVFCSNNSVVVPIQLCKAALSRKLLHKIIPDLLPHKLRKFDSVPADQSEKSLKFHQIVVCCATGRF